MTEPCARLIQCPKNNFAKRQGEEEHSGISPEISKVGDCLENITESFKERNKNQRKENKEKKKKTEKMQ